MMASDAKMIVRFMNGGLRAAGQVELAGLAGVSQLTLAALTPKRLLTYRWLSPDATVARTRTRRSSESGVDMAAILLAADRLNRAHASPGSPNQFKPLGSRSEAANESKTRDFYAHSNPRELGPNVGTSK
jgi:hypothetical protein